MYDCSPEKDNAVHEKQSMTPVIRNKWLSCDSFSCKIQGLTIHVREGHGEASSPFRLDLEGMMEYT